MNAIFRRLGTAVILIAFLAGCAPGQFHPAYWPTTGWRSSAPEEQGMDSELLAQMAEHIRAEKLDLHSLLIVRNGTLVSEIYDYPYTADQAHWVMSVTKSVISALVGIAIQKGYLQDVHQTLFSLLPEEGAANMSADKRAITLEDLLTQTSGLECRDNPAGGQIIMEQSDDWVQFMLNRPMAARPGEQFNYCTSATHLLSAVLQKATGMSAREFANQNLFAPLGIGPIPNARWSSDPQGASIGGYGIAFTPTEMAKLGYLFLNKGQWDGQTVVPAEWVAASTSSHSNQGDKKEYGYLWWVDPQGKWYAALGRFGEHIFVYPAQNLVVVFTAGLVGGTDADLTPLQELLDNYILPSIKSGRPLPANPGGLARLQAGIQALAAPELTAPGPLPAIAAAVSGKTYTFGNNPFNWKSMAFTFTDGASEAILLADGAVPVALGLDNAYRILPGEGVLFPAAYRGWWDQDTFVVENIAVGQPTHITARVQFVENTIRIDLQERYFGSKFQVTGTLAPEAQ